MIKKTALLAFALLMAGNVTAYGVPAPPFFSFPTPQVGVPGGDVASDMFTASEPGAPRIGAFSHEAYPDETVFLTGTGLEGAEFRVGFMASGGQLVTRHASVQVATDSYALVTLPDRIPRTFYFLWAVKQGKWSDAARINLPEPWWAYPDDPRPGEQVRVFGRELAVLPTLSNAYIYLEGNDKTGQYVAADFCDRWELRFTLPADLPAGPCRIWLHAGSAGRYGWGDPVEITVRPAAPKSQAEPLDLKPYGLTGNGITDDTAALQKALDDAAAQKRPIVLPNGRYVVSAPLIVADHVRLTGQSREKTVLLCASGDPMIGYGKSVLSNPPIGTSFDWEIEVPADGTYRIWLRHATGGGAGALERALTLQVDDEKPVTLGNINEVGKVNDSTKLQWAQVAQIPLKRGKHRLRWKSASKQCCELDAWILTDVQGYQPAAMEPELAKTGNTIVVQAEDFVDYASQGMRRLKGAATLTDKTTAAATSAPKVVCRYLESAAYANGGVVWGWVNRSGFLQVTGSDVMIENLTVSADVDRWQFSGVAVRPSQLGPKLESRTSHVTLRGLDISTTFRGIYVRNADHLVVEHCTIAGATPCTVSGDPRQLRVSGCELIARRFAGRTMRTQFQYGYPFSWEETLRAPMEELILEDCRFISDPPHGLGPAQGMFHSWPSLSRRHYIARNSCRHVDATPANEIYGLGTGEMILHECGTNTAWFGKIEKAGRDTLELPQKGPAWHVIKSGTKDGWFLTFVVKGKGQGQVRVIKEVRGSTLVLAHPWRVEPDESSVVTVATAEEEILILDNDLSRGTVGTISWPSWVNCVVARNQCDNMRLEGFLGCGGQFRGNRAHMNSASGTNLRYGLCWWNLYEGNTSKNVAYGVRINANARSTADYSGVLGNVARQNSVVNARAIGLGSDIRHVNADPRLGDIPALLGSIFEFNKVIDCTIGFYVDAGNEAALVRRNLIYDWNRPEQGTAVRVEKGAKNVIVQENRYSKGILIDNPKDQGVYDFKAPLLPESLDVR